MVICLEVRESDPRRKTVVLRSPSMKVQGLKVIHCISITTNDQNLKRGHPIILQKSFEGDKQIRTLQMICERMLYTFKSIFKKFR